MSDDTNSVEGGGGVAPADAKLALEALPIPAMTVAPPPKPKAAPRRKRAAPGVPPPVDVSDAKPVPRAEGERRDDVPPPPEHAGETIMPECPIVPLAREDAIYHFLTRAGEILSFSAKDLGDANISALFDGDTEWLRRVFPEWGKRTREEIAQAEKDGRHAPAYRTRAARDWLIRECAAAGMGDPRKDVRGVGAWRARNGDLILHLGDEVHRVAADGGGEIVQRAGCRIDGHIYPARPSEPRAADKAATPAAVAALHDLLGRWQWRAPVEASRLVLGWIIAGYIAGALAWRPHIYVTGDTGEGKSTFENLLRELFGGRALRSADPSAAFIRQQLQGAARPVLVDEIENSEVNTRARDVIETARLASSENQAATGRGSAGHKAVTFALNGCFYFSSILHPPMKPQDLGRITIFDLAPLPADPDGLAKAEIRRGIDDGKKLGAELQRLMMDRWPQLEAMRLMYDRAIGKLGKKSRVADQFGTMLACAHLALGTDPAEQEWIDKFVGGLELGAFLDRDEAEGESQACVSRLLTFALDAWGEGIRKTLSRALTVVINDKLEGVARGHAHQAVQAYGLRVEKDLFTAKQAEALGVSSMPPGPWLVVAHAHDGLGRVFNGTRWADGVWNQALRRVPGAQTNPGRGVKMGGLVRKGIWMPLKTMLDGSAWGAIAPDDSPEPPDVTGDTGVGYEGGYGEEAGGSDGSGKS